MTNSKRKYTRQKYEDDQYNQHIKLEKLDTLLRMNERKKKKGIFCLTFS